ncbi:MAG: methyltransferase domain-containing protein [Candidatus Stahlbacteria bacterium]|nr:methyltransferase domain-containing protein [Candidatus Stahlbacteria bacterium]
MAEKGEEKPPSHRNESGVYSAKSGTPLQQRRGKGVKHGVKLLGPVKSLEEHVSSDWWCRIFNSLYLKTDGDIVDDQSITRQEIDLFSNILKLSPEDKVLDLCCGQGRHALEFARRGFKYIDGLDRSHYLIQKSKSTAKKEGIFVKFREGDARKLPYTTDSFDVVMILGNSFGYFDTVKEDLRVLKEVIRVLKPWAKLLIDVADGAYLRANFHPRSWEWIDKSHFVCRERSLSTDEQRLISREVINHTQKGVLADQFYAERLYTKESLTHLLEEAGFKDVVFHAEFIADSKRNQDLGMMERRLIASAVARKEWTPEKKKPKEDAQVVAVVLGDPGRQDVIKPLAVFDEDDFYTIDQLKDALRELPSYRFIYLNNHTTLIPDLLNLRGKVDFVLNLCDEGYYNEPIKELHIPALLEILGISYTGSGPQCLANCYDKSLVRGIAEEMGIPIPKAFFIKPEDTVFGLQFDFPVIVKPNFGDSSFGITQRSVATNVETLVNAISEIRDKFGYDKPILVEEYLTGSDVSVGIIGNPPESYKILPLIEEDYSLLPDGLPRICGYEAKWLPNSPYWNNIKSIPANLQGETQKLIREWCVELFERLDCRDYCRFDWRLDSEGNPHLLEVNPNPGWCWDGHLAKMAKIANISYKEMLEKILQTVEQRIGLPTITGDKQLTLPLPNKTKQNS